jgi:predicted transcriptional regulator of viral defense system
MRSAVSSAPSIWETADQRFDIVTGIPAHFFGDEDVWIGDTRVRVFDREQAMLDCFALPRRFGGLAEGLGVVEEHLHELDVERLVAHAQRCGTASVAKRVGYVLEHVGVASRRLTALPSMPIAGYRPLDPTKPLVGERNQRWGLIVNLTAG